MTRDKIIIYQLFPRLFGNRQEFTKYWGTINENGCGKFNDISEEVLKKLKELGVNHIWLTGIIRHAKATSYPAQGLEGDNPGIIKGMAGSPYAIKDFYDVDPDLATNPDLRKSEFEDLVKRIKNSGIKVVIDFVPNHVSRAYKSLEKPSGIEDLGEYDDKNIRFSPNNNFYYLPDEKLVLPEDISGDKYVEDPAKATGNNVFNSHPSRDDWYETVKLNYGVDPQYGIKQFDPIPDTWNKMTNILTYWTDLGVDGFRCDMAGMVPVEFWQYAITNIKRKNRSIIFIAELYEPDKYREYIEIGGFDYLYDKVGLYDSIRDIMRLRGNTDAISLIWQKLDGLDPHMLRFMENHDEHRIASGHFVGDPWKGLPATALSALMSTGPVMIYNGQELGEEAAGSSGYSGDDGKTTIFDYSYMPTVQKWFNNGKCDGALLSSEQIELRRKYTEILQFACNEEEIKGQFYDLMWQNQDLPDMVRDKIYAFLRYNSDSVLLIVVSFNRDINNLKIRIPQHALELTGLDNKDRFSVSYLYPETGESNLILSQLTGSGISVNFDQSAWTAIRIN